MEGLIFQGNSFQNITCFGVRDQHVKEGQAGSGQVPPSWLRPLLSSEQPWGRRIEGPKGAESWAQGPGHHLEDLGAQRSVPRNQLHSCPTPICQVSFETLGKSLKSRHFSAMYIWITAPALSVSSLTPQLMWGSQEITDKLFTSCKASHP